MPDVKDFVIKRGRLKATITIVGAHKCVGYDARGNLLRLAVEERPTISAVIVGMER